MPAGGAAKYRKRADDLDRSIRQRNGKVAKDNGVPNSVLIQKPFVPVQVVNALAELLKASEQQADRAPE